MSGLDPRNLSFPVFADAARTARDVEVMESDLIRHQSNNQIAAMARIFLHTCPGDWDRGWGPLSRGCLRAAVQGNECPDPPTDIAAMIAFRWEAGLVADYIVRECRLTVPDDQPCIMWNINVWTETAQTVIPNYEEKSANVWKALRNSDVEAEPSDIQGPPFTRFAEYLNAATVASELSTERHMEVVGQMSEFMRKMRESANERNVEAAICSDGVVIKSSELFKSL